SRLAQAIRARVPAGAAVDRVGLLVDAAAAAPRLAGGATDTVRHGLAAGAQARTLVAARGGLGARDRGAVLAVQPARLKCARARAQGGAGAAVSRARLADARLVDARGGCPPHPCDTRLDRGVTRALRVAGRAGPRADAHRARRVRAGHRGAVDPAGGARLDSVAHALNGSGSADARAHPVDAGLAGASADGRIGDQIGAALDDGRRVAADVIAGSGGRACRVDRRARTLLPAGGGVAKLLRRADAVRRPGAAGAEKSLVLSVAVARVLARRRAPRRGSRRRGPLRGPSRRARRFPARSLRSPSRAGARGPPRRRPRRGSVRR